MARDGGLASSHRALLSNTAKPPEALRQVYKKYQRASWEHIESASDFLDLGRPTSGKSQSGLQECEWHLPDSLVKSFETFERNGKANHECHGGHPTAYSFSHLPGLLIIPSLLSRNIQTSLLSRLLHRELSKPEHKTNLHLHYQIPYPDKRASFFHYDHSSDVRFTPLDAGLHKPLSIAQVLNQKLRWVTLGGQYDWTKKQYPAQKPPEFPPDIARLLHDLFPNMNAEAAIVNIYSGGDTLSLHRDVAEESGERLISLSIGCDAVFIAGLADDEASGSIEHLAVRLRSGDALVMADRARYAWHGVPQVLRTTCPDWLRDWPGAEGNDEFQSWKGWMASKRINLNVRQMFDPVE